MKYNDEFDQILDEALAEYREAEPLAGVEDRALHRIQFQASRRRKLLTFWRSIALAAAAAAIVAIWLGLSARSQHETPAQAIARDQTPASQPQSKPSTEAAPHSDANASSLTAKTVRSRPPRTVVMAHIVASEPGPMRDMFPTPAPLTPSERTLLALAQTHPLALQELPQHDADNEIAIAPIIIKPLAENVVSSGGEN